MKKGDISFLDELVRVLKESQIKLKEFYEAGDSENFNSTKKFMIQVQRQLEETLR